MVRDLIGPDRLKGTKEDNLRLSVWQPLTCQGRPVESMGYNEVVEEWRVLLPDLYAWLSEEASKRWIDR
jgi:hypothetical protein